MALRTAGRGSSAPSRGGARGVGGATSVERGRGGSRGGGRLGGRGGEIGSGGDRGSDRFYARSTSYDESEAPTGVFASSSREKANWDPDGAFLPVNIPLNYFRQMRNTTMADFCHKMTGLRPR